MRPGRLGLLGLLAPGLLAAPACSSSSSVTRTCSGGATWCQTTFRTRPEVMVVMPGKPFKINGNPEAWGFELERGADRGRYEVGWMEISGLENLEELHYEPAFHILEKEFANEKLRVAHAQPVSLGSLPGREYFVRNTDVHGKARVFIDDDLLYFVYADTERSAPLDHVDRYVTSLRIQSAASAPARAP